MLFNGLSHTLWLVPCYALAGTILALSWSPGLIRNTGPRPAGYINILLTLVGFVHSILAFSYLANHATETLSWSWLNSSDLHISLDLEFSAVNAVALIVITGLNLLVQIYAVGYMEMDWGWARFYSLLGLFQAGLSFLVICNSLFFSYVILEILTLGTYLLVGLWFNQSLVVTGARDAFLTKRVGDLVLLMGVVALLPLSHTWNYNELAIWATHSPINSHVATLLCLALIAGPLGKCAQFPLHLWLDEAMEGPIPATILRNTIVVSSGAWVLVKLEPIFALSPLANTVMISIGAVTAVGASCIAIAQIDLKRSLSYSVSAYMGLIFIAVGTGQTQTALTLLLTYSIAMSLLVAVVGGIIWNTVSQDLTKYGGLWSRRPISGLCYLVGCAGLVAFPPLGGFWALSEMVSHLDPLLGGVVILVNGLTAFSVIREFSLLFGGAIKPMTVRSSEALWPLIVPTVILAGFALHLPLLLQTFNLIVPTSLPTTIVLTLSSLVGGGLAAYIYLNEEILKPLTWAPQNLRDFFAYDLYTAQVYRLTIVSLVGIVSQAIALLDRYIVDGLVNLVGLVTLISGEGLKYNASGQGQFYILSILLGIAFFGLLICWPLLNQISLIFTN